MVSTPGSHSIAPTLIVVHGGQGDEPVAAVAPRHSSIRFALSQGSVTGPNIASYELRLEQAAFLAGAFAAWSSRTHTIAHLSGECVTPGLKGRDAYAEGAAYADAEVGVLSTFCGSHHDAAMANRCANAHAAAGADILFTMLGAGRAGAIASCRQSGMRQIGDGVDWCAREPGVFIASAVADSAWGCFQAVADFAAGEFPNGMRKSVGLDRPELCRLAVGADIDGSVLERITELAKSVAAGTISIEAHWSGTDFPAPDGHGYGAR